MGTILLLLFLFFLVFYIIIPLGRLIMRGWMFHRQWKQATDNLRNAFNGGGRGGSSQQPEQPKRKKKKIDPNVGEYVAFEEIKVSAETTTETGDSYSSVRTESQIEDITWEDVK